MHTITQLILDNNVAFHPMMGNSYKLNETGKEIIAYLKEGKSKDEIIKTLSEKYKISPDELFIDIGDFFAKLRVYGLQQ